MRPSVCKHALHRSLEESLKDSKPVAIQLRMLEVFTSHDSYHNPADPAGNRKDAAMVTIYLVRNGINVIYSLFYSLVVYFALSLVNYYYYYYYYY